MGGLSPGMLNCHEPVCMDAVNDEAEYAFGKSVGRTESELQLNFERKTCVVRIQLLQPWPAFAGNLMSHGHLPSLVLGCIGTIASF